MKFSIAIGGSRSNLDVAAFELRKFLEDHQAQVAIFECDSEDAEKEEFYEDADVLIVLGGDGSIIHEAGKAALYQTPVLGINYGHLGYLAELDNLDFDLLEKLFTKTYTVEEQMMLHVERGTESYTALNDVVVTRIKSTGVVDLKFECNGKSLGTHRSDGAIVSTPIGSTGYALAAGGSVIDPSLEVIALSSICPHSLSSRQILLSPESVLKVYNKNRTGEDANFATDGRNLGILPYGEALEIRKSDKKAHFIRLTSRYFYENIKKKLIE